LGYAVHLVNRSALDEFARAVQTVNGAADLQVQATQARGFDENLYPVLARIPGVAQASPVVELTLPLPERRRLTVLGLDVLRAARVTPALLGRPFKGEKAGDSAGEGAAFDVFAEDAVYLSSAAASALNAQPGQALRLDASTPDAQWTYRGTLPGASDSRLLAVMDIAAAQWKLDSLGRLQRVDLALLPGADVLWALEQALKSGQVGAVLAWLPVNLRADALRRLQLAAQAQAGPVFLFRDALARGRPSPAPLRLLLQPAGADNLSVRLLTRRGPQFTQPLRLALPPVLPAHLQARLQSQAAAQQVSLGLADTPR
jgi:hypothetical protein